MDHCLASLSCVVGHGTSLIHFCTFNNKINSLHLSLSLALHLFVYNNSPTIPSPLAIAVQQQGDVREMPPPPHHHYYHHHHHRMTTASPVLRSVDRNSGNEILWTTTTTATPSKMTLQPQQANKPPVRPCFRRLELLELLDLSTLEERDSGRVPTTSTTTATTTTTTSLMCTPNSLDREMILPSPLPTTATTAVERPECTNPVGRTLLLWQRDNDNDDDNLPLAPPLSPTPCLLALPAAPPKSTQVLRPMATRAAGSTKTTTTTMMGVC